MDLFICSKTMVRQKMIDAAKSKIWTTRYNTVGDFEIYVPADSEIVNFAADGYFVMRDGDERVGIIDKNNLTIDSESGDYLKISGSMAESILNNRIIWAQTNITGTAEDGIRQLITENIINPTDTGRKIDDFVLGVRKGFTETLDAQYTGDNLLTVISDICKTFDYGFKVIYADGFFTFDLYRGLNRTDTQITNNRCVFSEEFENIGDAEYISDKTKEINAVLVAGEGEGTARKTATVGTVMGLDRKEKFVDARNLSTNNGAIADTDYQKSLEAKGQENILPTSEILNAEISTVDNYVYKTDFNIGDTITQKINRYGLTVNKKIIEIIECEDDKGYSIIPTVGD